MRKSYLDYAMSVIVSRALPDVRDGLKPVHRRILYSMGENGYDYNKAYRKSARVVGDVIGKYHPHGDTSIYDALVRMAQDFSMRLPLLDGQGNFGSIDGDPPAAMRYTEVRMGKPAHALLEDIDKDTVDFQDNYDSSEREPMVLPARLPNLLSNGANGIAVGMATNIPPHNLGELIDGCLALIDNPEFSDEELLQLIPGPDFPTGGLILGQSGSRSAVLTGRGSVIMRGRVQIENVSKDKEAIIINEIPYQLNKTTMIEKIADLVRDKTIEGISDIRDESDRDGMRVVIELKRDAVADVVQNQLYRFSQLQSSFPANMLALNNGRPELMNLRQMLQAFIAFREVVITRRSKFELNKARDRAHVLVGLAIAVENIDEIIALIRKAPSPQSAREQLMGKDWKAENVRALIGLIDDPLHRISDAGTYRLSEAQARAILELRLQRLTAMGRDEIGGELQGLGAQITDLLDLLRSHDRVMAIICAELADMKKEYATPRRSEFIEDDGEVDDESLIPQEDMVVTVSHAGYIKRVPLSTYRAQRRGGKGRAGMTTKDEDFVTRIFIANTHQPILFFSTTGMVYKLKVWKLPAAAPQARGKALVNMLPLDEGEGIAVIMALPQNEEEWRNLNIVFATTRGNVRRNDLSDFVQVNRRGKIAMKPDEGEHIVGVETCQINDDVLLTTSSGQSIRFCVEKLRLARRSSSTGVRGIRLAENASVISMAILRHSDATPAQRQAYLKQAAAMRRALNEEEAEETEEITTQDEGDSEVVEEETHLTSEQYAKMGAAEEFLLTISENGYGKRSSAYEYRVSGRGGKGIKAMTMTARNGNLLASFPIDTQDQIMLVTDKGTVIRCPVNDIRIAGRSTQGVTIFRTEEDAKVVSVARLADTGEDEDLDEDDELETQEPTQEGEA
ncbi:MAG: DNA gyrase subunit A [Alphaproteobacteria bacterium]|nr:DNA gyrase subunit A [Alphaproteobacteria bacterium]MBE8220688.1 DNA gyrase subunit A [Alphaproteobacteria bacterium]